SVTRRLVALTETRNTVKHLALDKSGTYSHQQWYPYHDLRAEGNSGGMRVTMRQVADRAGVSAMTVSRVINHSPRVSDEARTRVEAAIAELGYVPNRLARGLIRQ